MNIPHFVLHVLAPGKSLLARARHPIAGLVQQKA
jgi:hypothetical protein